MNSKLKSKNAVTVFGAYGHTGRFVVAELRKRGWKAILSGLDPEKLKAVGEGFGDDEIRVASAEDPVSLDRALEGAAAVINCAGPFAATSAAVIEAALRARIDYLDVAAEVEVVSAVFESYDERAREAGIVILPSMAFYGGLGDLLATAALGNRSEADEISLAYALDSWIPTGGTRRTIETSKRRRAGRRLVFSNRRMELRSDEPPTGIWKFPPPFGEQKVVGEFTTADSVTIPAHLETKELRTFMTLAPLKDLTSPESAPASIDEDGRSGQKFLVEAIVRARGEERRAIASGQDIYAVTAPLAVEAFERLAAARKEFSGVVSAGEIFPAEEFLKSLSPRHLTFTIE